MDAGALADGEVADGAVGEADHVFAAGDTVVACFEGLGGAVERAAGVAGVDFGPGLEVVIVPAPGVPRLRVGEVRDGILKRDPRQEALVFRGFRGLGRGIG